MHLQYFLVVLSLLLVEFSVCLMITLWPHCVGLDLDETKMVKELQGNYGVPGNEQVAANGYLDFRLLDEYLFSSSSR